MARRTKKDQRSYEILENNFRHLPDSLELWDWINSIFNHVIDEIKPKDYDQNENAEFYNLYKRICEQNKKTDIDRLLYLDRRSVRISTIDGLFTSFRSSFFLRNPKIYHVFKVSTDGIKYLYKSLHGMSRFPQLKNNARDFMRKHWNIDIDLLKTFDRLTKDEKEKSKDIIQFIKACEPIKRNMLEANFPKDLHLIEKLLRLEKIEIALIENVQHYVTKKNIDRQCTLKYKTIAIEKGIDEYERLDLNNDQINIRSKHLPYLEKRDTSDETEYHKITEKIKPEDFDEGKVSPRDLEAVRAFKKRLKTNK